MKKVFLALSLMLFVGTVATANTSAEPTVKIELKEKKKEKKKKKKKKSKTEGCCSSTTKSTGGSCCSKKAN